MISDESMAEIEAVQRRHRIEATVQKFRSLIVEVEAMQCTAEATMDVLQWVPAERQYLTDEAGTPKFYIRTRDGGRTTVYLDDWVVRDEFGNFWPVNAAEFERRYEPMEAEA